MKSISIVHVAHHALNGRLVGSLVILLLAMSPPREAAALPLVHEGFNYLPGQSLPTMAKGFGWAPGPWTGSAQMVDQPPTLSYPSALPPTGDALFNPLAGEAWRNFKTKWDNSLNDLWISFQEETPAAGSGAFVDVLPVSGLDIQVNKTAVGIITLNGVAAGFSAGIGNVDFFVLQVSHFSGGVTWVNLYLNPGPMLSPVPTASFPIPSVVQIQQFYYRTDPGQLLDEIRVGTTLQDVAAAQGTGGGTGAQFFRVCGPNATSIVSLGADGTLVFSNAIVGDTYTIQVASSLASGQVGAGTGNGIVWVDDHQVIASNSIVHDSVLFMMPLPMRMIDIPGGTFTMGDNLDGEYDAIPTTVNVSEFYMDVTPVRYGDWRSVAYIAVNEIPPYSFADPGTAKKANHPVQAVNWYDCVKWCNARSVQDGLTPCYYTDSGFTKVYINGEVEPYVNWNANGYRLPTEAEWEYAARGGLSGQRFPWGSTISESQANYYGKTADFAYDLGPNGSNAKFLTGGPPYTSPVASFAPNRYGLYDMAGNVEEWCQDWYAQAYAGGTDPHGPASGFNRVLRAGDWNQFASWARCANRDLNSPFQPSAFFGFRCVRGH